MKFNVIKLQNDIKIAKTLGLYIFFENIFACLYILYNYLQQFETIFVTFLSQTHAEEISAGKFVFVRGDVTINRLINNKKTQIKVTIQ